MKKVLSLLLSACLLIGVLFVPVSAAPTKEYPTIIVAGYSSSALFLNNPDGTTDKVWGVNVDDILALVLHKIAQIGISLGALTFGKYQMLADIVGQGAVDLYGVLAFNENGKSVNDIHPFSFDPAVTNFAYLYENGLDAYAYEPEIMATVAEIYGENGYENIFSYQHDFRENIIDSAADLDRYIDNVLAYTGAEKVNLYAVSHGGEISAVYFSEYGYKNKVHNAVLTIPAIGGAALAYDVMSETIELDEETLLYFIENGMMLEEDYDWLVRADKLGILDPICNRVAGKWVKQILGYWGSIWDFIPCEYYDDLKNAFLDETLSADLIAKSDYYHYTVMPNMTRSLQTCVDNGTNIYIVAGCDNPSVTGLQKNSDGIITVNGSTGAYCADYGTRFADGFSGLHTVCTDETHNHISPAMNIDLSAGFLPEYTWAISGLFHGMTWKDKYSIDLCCKLLFEEDRCDVHMFPEYPQYHYSTNVCYSVCGEFDRSVHGYLGAEDQTLLVTNLSEKYPMRLMSVNCSGADIRFKINNLTFLAPGETVAIAFEGELPEKSFTTVDIDINYFLFGSITPFGCRTQKFTLLNGDITDVGSGFVKGSHDTPFDAETKDFIKNILIKIGFYDLFRMFYNYFAGIINILFK